MLMAPGGLITLSEALFSPEDSLRDSSAREGRSLSFHWQLALMIEYLKVGENERGLSPTNICKGLDVNHLNTHNVLEQLNGFFKLFPR